MSVHGHALVYGFYFHLWCSIFSFLSNVRFHLILCILIFSSLNVSLFHVIISPLNGSHFYLLAFNGGPLELNRDYHDLLNHCF